MSRLRPQRRKIRWKRLWLLLIILLTFIASLSWAAVHAYQKFSSVPASSAPAVSTQEEKHLSSEPTGKYVNILLMGIDDGDQEYPNSPRRSDAMIVASINQESGAINLLSIPRDTRVAIQGQKGFEKITHAYYYGGATLAVHTVEQLLNVPIHYYIVIDWQAFIKTVDVLGGVDLYVENNMNYEDPYANLVIHLTKGYQHLDGSKAGQYVRFRSDELGDIGRVQRQQRFMRAMAEQTMHLGIVLKVPSLMGVIKDYVKTDITPFKMIKLVNSLKSFKSSELRGDMLPGHFATINGISFWVYDQEQTNQLVDHIFSDDETK